MLKYLEHYFRDEDFVLRSEITRASKHELNKFMPFFHHKFIYLIIELFAARMQPESHNF